MKLNPSTSKSYLSTHSSSNQITSSNAGLWLGVLVVGTLTLFFGLVNWMWLRANVVTYGWDRMDHLIASLAYNNMLGTLSPPSLFEALAWSDYYPPLVHLVVVMGYKIFGVNEDVAAMMNVLYLLLLLGAVWHIGRRLGGLAVALLATLVISTFPMIYTMSRYLYIDFALTSLIAVSMASLLASERFTRYGVSLLFGLSLGAAFLVKWTAAAFMAFPLLLILWRGGILHQLVRNPSFLRPDGRRLFFSFAIGGLLAALWVLPARQVAAQQPLDLWLIPLFATFIAAVVYGLLAYYVKRGNDWNDVGRRDQITALQITALFNALNAGAVAALTFSWWYLPNINFLQAFYTNAYGKPAGRHWGYAEYLDYVVTEQLGPLYTALFLLLVTFFLWVSYRQGSWRKWRMLSDTELVLLLWAFIPFLIFATRVSTIHSRYLMPFLPPFALWISASSLWQLRPKALRVSTIGLVMLLAWAQFAIISFDSLAEWRERFIVGLPGLPSTEMNLLAHGFSIQYPTKGVNDTNFAITPDILATIEEKRTAQGRERVRLGLIVDSYQIHEKHFLYQIYIRFPHIFLHELARNWSGQPTYKQLFEMDYVLLGDTHNHHTSKESQQVVERILGTPDDAFTQAFQEVARWTIPSNETIILYERRFAETEPGISPPSYQRLMEELGPHFGEGDALILTAPNQIYIMGLSLPEEAPVTLLPLPMDASQPAEAIESLVSAAQQHQRLFLLSHNNAVVDPEGQIEGWLRHNTIPGPEIWIDALRVNTFIPTMPPAISNNDAFTIQFGNSGPTLQGYGFDAGPLKPGTALTTALLWEAADTAGLKLSLQLISPDGTLVAQRDTDVSTGTQAHALLIPRLITPGTYHLIVSVYQPDTLQRLHLPDGRDALELGVIEVRE